MFSHMTKNSATKEGLVREFRVREILDAACHVVARRGFQGATIDRVAEEAGIKHQAAFLPAGGTDAGQIHLAGMGAPSLFLGIPTRYIHSHHGMLDLADVENAIKLLVELIKRLDQKTVSSFTEL